MGGGISCDGRECTWCLSSDRGTTKNYCISCHKKLVGDIPNYCSHCKVFDGTDKNGYYHYRVPIILPWSTIDYTF
jgi:hypothetical protein